MVDVKRVSPQQAQALLAEGYVYIDVRSEPEFADGHPEGAFNVPLLHLNPGGMQPNPRFLEVMRANFPLETKVVLGCKAGNRSMRAATALLAEGYTFVVDQRAGWDGVRDPFGQVTEVGWGPLGLPSETGQIGARSYGSLSRGD